MNDQAKRKRPLTTEPRQSPADPAHSVAGGSGTDIAQRGFGANRFTPRREAFRENPPLRCCAEAVFFKKVFGLFSKLIELVNNYKYLLTYY